jgi:hypothetical protein
MALLAATTLGIDGSTFRAKVRADDVDDRAAYRLVVQTYDRPMKASRPVGSVQRVVTGAELRDGVEVCVLELRDGARASAKELVVAWIEDGTRELELDARTARPPRGSVYGAVRKPSGDGSVRISLSRGLGRARKLAA